MSLTNPQLNMQWWTKNLVNDPKYADWAKKNLALAKAIGHVAAAGLLGKKNPGQWLDAANAAVDALENAEKKCSDKELKAALVKLANLARGEASSADDVKRQNSYNKQDEKTKKLMDESMENAMGRRTNK